MFSFRVGLFVLALPFIRCLDCGNPIFTDEDTNWGSGDLPLAQLVLSNFPMNFPSGSQTCTYYSQDQQCCTSYTLSQISEQFGMFDQASSLLRNKQISVANSTFPSGFYYKILSAITTLCQIQQCPAYMDVVVNFNTDLSAAVEALGSDSVQDPCFSALQAYIEGMICFACNADYATFITVNPTNTVAVLPSTADHVYAACAPVFGGVINVLNVMYQYTSTLVNLIPGLSQNYLTDIANTPDMCGGKQSSNGVCKQWVRTNLLNGFGVPDYRWPTPALDGDFDDRTSLPPSPVAETPAREVVSRSGVPVAKPRYNQYVATGYDAYSIGCMNQDNGECVPLSSSTTTGFPVWAIVVSVLGVVVIMASFIMYWRNKQSTIFREYEALGSGGGGGGG